MLNMVSATAPEMMEYFQPSCTENTRKPNMPTTMEGSEDNVSMAVEAMSRIGSVRRVLNQKDRSAQADGHRDDQGDQQQVERVEQLVEHAALRSVGARRLREKARLEQRRDALEQDIGHHGDDDEHDDGDDRRQHARGEAVLLLDTPEPRLVDVDTRASHEPSPPCGR